MPSIANSTTKTLLVRFNLIRYLVWLINNFEKLEEGLGEVLIFKLATQLFWSLCPKHMMKGNGIVLSDNATTNLEI
jgi:hypothetical protein